MTKFSKLALVICLIIQGLLTGKLQQANASVNSDTLIFIQITDPHVCNLTGYHSVFAKQRQQFSGSAKNVSDFLKIIPKKYNADFVVVTGDNVDFYEAEASDGSMIGTQIEQYAGLLDVSEVPVCLALGNHDISSYRVTSDSGYTNNQIEAEKARAVWMRNLGCFSNGTYYSRIFKVDTTTFRLIFLDNSYTATEEISDGILPFVVDPYQLRWLDAQLKASPVDFELIFMHIPFPFSRVSDENIPGEQLSGYFSKVKFYDLLNVIDTNSYKGLIFTGHRHFNSINNFILPDGSTFTQVLTAAFGYSHDAWRMVKMTADKIFICYPGSTKTQYTFKLQ